MKRTSNQGAKPWASNEASKGWADSVKKKEEQDTAIEPLLVPEKVAAVMLGVSPRTVWSLGDAGEVAFKRIGRRKNYLVSSLKSYAQNSKGVL